MISSMRPSAILYFILVFNFCSLQVDAQSHPPVYREIIVELPVLSTGKNLNTTIFGLVALGGIKYEGYCEQMKCLLLSADQNIHPDNGLIMNKLKELAGSFIIKPTGKIHQVLSSCKDPVAAVQDPEPSGFPDK